MTPSPLTPADIALACERLFQAGGPRVYVQDPDGTIRPSYLSAARTVAHKDPEQTVWARRKNGYYYRFRQVSEARK